VSPEPIALAFRAVTLATLVGVPLFALRSRGRGYALFALVVLGVSLPGALVTQARLGASLGPGPLSLALAAAFLWGALATALHFALLARARLRSRPFRALVSIPAQGHVAAGLLASVFQLALAPPRAALALAGADGALAALAWLDPLPYAAALLAVVTSARPRREWVRVRVGAPGPERLCRAPVERHRRRPPPAPGRALRLVQIADPHLGPWQSVRRMQRRLASLLAHEPHLVLLTGDFLTMEGGGSRGALAEAFAPLRGAAGRCFAVFGNHDHEAPDEVRAALAANGVRLLCDEEALVATPAGPVQLLGADWATRGRRERLHALLGRHPRRDGSLRLLLLHDPSGFHDLPDDAVDLVLSGHTHGGQIGLVSAGLDWTVLARSRWPDHGLFARGRSRLYVHRGTGFYGFPLRLGVPGELSVLEVLAP
jgi:hypothetical protein